MNVFSFFYDCILIIIGSILAAFGTASFLLPNQLSSGGFSGIATITYYFLKIPMSNTILFLNIPLFIIAYFKFGKKFILKTFFTTALFSYFIDVFSKYQVNIDDKLLISIYAGIIIGIGLGIIFKANSSTGGTDLIAQLMQAFKIKIKISNIIIGIDVIVVFSNLLAFNSIEIGLYSMITIIIIGKMIDVVFEGINYSKVLYIVTDEYEKITEVINTNLNRGATLLYSEGSYYKKYKKIIMCVVKRNDILKIESECKQIDPNVFIIVTDAREVFGLGFKNFN